MQNILIRQKMEGIVGTPVDHLGDGASIPEIGKYLTCKLRFRLMQDDGLTQYDATDLANIVTWYFVIANDWDPDTASQIKTFTNIDLEVTEAYTDIIVTLSANETNTPEIIAALNTKEFDDFKIEIGGLEAGSIAADFCLQSKIIVRNRLEGTDSPTSLPATYWTAVEVAAYVALAPDFEFSIDGATLWHIAQVAADRYYRESRNGGEWSEAIELIVGPAGTDGADGVDGTGVYPQGTYIAGTSYALNEGVTYEGSYYRSLAAANIGNQPDTSPAQWELMISIGATGPVAKRIIKASNALAASTVELDAYIDIYTKTVDTATTFIFNTSGLTLVADDVITFELHINMTTVSTLTFPASVSWIETPLMNDIKTYVLVFRSTDAGTNWLANLAYEVD